MGSDSVSMKKEEVRLAYDAGVLLQQIAEGLFLRKFECQGEEGTFVVEVPDQVKIKFGLKEKSKKGAVKTKVKLEMTWATPCPEADEDASEDAFEDAPEAGEKEDVQAEEE